jgi:hypothetical protein
MRQTKDEKAPYKTQNKNQKQLQRTIFALSKNQICQPHYNTLNKAIPPQVPRN